MVGFGSWPNDLLALCPWTNYLTSISLSFLISEIGILKGLFMKINLDNANEVPSKNPVGAS